MTDPFPAETPVVIDRVDRARTSGDRVRLRLTGRRLVPPRESDLDPLLVIQLHGRRHRFPASDPRNETESDAAAWAATFEVPAWAEPSRYGQAAVWMGDAVVPVPLSGVDGAGPQAPPAAVATAAPGPGATAAPDTDGTPVPSDGDGSGDETEGDVAVDSGRTGPLAELLFKDNVSALHSELEQRSAETAQWRAALAGAQSELEARRANQAALESAHADLRAELRQLTAAAAAQREEFAQRASELETQLGSAEAQRMRAAEQAAELTAAHDVQAAESARLRDRLGAASSERRQRDGELAALREQLAHAHVSRDSAAGEAAGLRAELDRLATELAVAREQLAADDGDLGEAERLLADARALTAQLRGETPD